MVKYKGECPNCGNCMKGYIPLQVEIGQSSITLQCNMCGKNVLVKIIENSWRE